MQTRAITVSQLNNYIKQVFEAEELLHNVQVVGEISGIGARGSAVYFSIKDDLAVVQCVSYVPALFKDIKDGESVVVRGTVGYWHKAGKISFTVTKIEKFGIGALFLKFKELQERLAKEGFFDLARKRSIPKDVKRIGVVTSRQGAVLHDIVRVAHRRNPNVEIVLYPVQVQGVGAENTIASGIRYFKNVDVVIVARGGGSAEDLAAFNTEDVARAVFESKIPVVSAIGHETDWTLIDFVADIRAPTPSVAAELVVGEVLIKRERLLQAWRLLKLHIMGRLNCAKQDTISCYYDVRNTTRARVDGCVSRVRELYLKIEGMNMFEILRRGYSKIIGVDNVKDVREGDKLTIKMYNGEIIASVEEVKYG